MLSVRNDVLEDLRLLTNFAMDAEQRMCLIHDPPPCLGDVDARNKSGHDDGIERFV